MLGCDVGGTVGDIVGCVLGCDVGGTVGVVVGVVVGVAALDSSKSGVLSGLGFAETEGFSEGCRLGSTLTDGCNRRR